MIGPLAVFRFLPLLPFLASLLIVVSCIFCVGTRAPKIPYLLPYPLDLATVPDVSKILGEKWGDALSCSLGLQSVRGGEGTNGAIAQKSVVQPEKRVTFRSLTEGRDECTLSRLFIYSNTLVVSAEKGQFEESVKCQMLRRYVAVLSISQE